MSLPNLYRFIFLLSMASLIFFGCSDDDTITGDDNGVTDVDLDSALVELTDLLEMMVDSVFDNGDAALNDFDYSGLHDFFKSYLQSHPGDPTASFGAAITTVMMFGTSDKLDSLVNEVMDYADSISGPFKLIVPNPEKLSGKGEMLRFPTEISGAGIEKNFLAQSYFAILSKALADPMDISDAQEFIKTDFMPALDDAIGYMDNILDDPGYIFWVTPAMMAGTISDSIEIDHPDFLTFAAGLRTIKSFCHLVVAYNVDVPSYDSTGIAWLINQSNDWMSLHNDGDTHMAAARTVFLDAVGLVDDAITALEAEQASDLNQSNDLIKADWEPWEFDEAHDVIDSVNTYLTTPQWVVGYFDNDQFEDSVRVDASAIFDNPIDGIFSLLPPYSAEIIHVADTFYYPYGYWVEEYYMAIITWEANTYEEWIIPNPSINGILPDITTDAAFKDLLGLTSEDWTKTMELEFDFY